MVVAPRASSVALKTHGSGSECPVRTCVGCRVRCEDVDLLRVVVADGVLIPDPRRRLPGRGAWIHPREGCIAIAEKRRAFERALRVSRGLDVTPIRRYADTDGAGGRSPSPTATFRKLGNEVDPS